MGDFLTWSDSATGTWGGNDFSWEDVSLIDEIIQSGGGVANNILSYANSLPKKRKLQLIKIILTLQNKDFIESKYKKDIPIKIHINDIKFLLENRSKITVIVEPKLV